MPDTPLASLAVVCLHTSPLARPGAGDSGGLNVYVRELCAALAHAGTDLTIYTRRTAADKPEVVEVEPGVTLIHVDAGPPQLAKHELPSVVESFTEGVARHLRHRPVDAIHAHYWLSATVAHKLKHRFDIPLGVTFHTLARVKSAAGNPEPEGRARNEQTAIDCADVVFTSGPAEADQLTRHYRIDPDRIAQLTPGVDLAFFSPGPRHAARAAIGLPPDQLADPLLLFVGRLQPLKGADIAVAALAQLQSPLASKARLVVVGGPSGPEGQRTLDRLRSQAAAAGVADRVTFTDPQPHHMLSSYYRAADACVVPSRSESFGLVALEAAACATPVVAADVGGLRNNIVDGVTGLLVAGRDPADYAAHIDELLDNPVRSLELGDAACRRAASFTWSASAAAATAAFEATLNAELLVCV